MFDYSDSVYPVREDIQSAHRAFWQALAQPGTWLTGEQRVAVAAETRAALDCDYGTFPLYL
ncbi:MAG: hypothetical protein KDI36_07910 [Pseudomonadales bacterium]|nr:hypothetical protein [Pseudomonadales bacterium]